MKITFKLLYPSPAGPAWARPSRRGPPAGKAHRAQWHRHGPAVNQARAVTRTETVTAVSWAPVTDSDSDSDRDRVKLP